MESLNSTGNQPECKNCRHFNFGTDVLELCHPSQPAGEHANFRHFALRVKSLPDALQAFSDKGFRPEFVSKSANGNFATIHDPDGVKIKLFDGSDLSI